jgi:hypothetical protein
MTAILAVKQWFSIRQSLPSNSDSQANEREYVLYVLGENDYPKRLLNYCERNMIDIPGCSERTTLKAYLLTQYHPTLLDATLLALFEHYIG